MHGFAGRCLTTRPLHRGDGIPESRSRYPRADDGIRTRDPNLGKVVRYQLRHVRTLLGGVAASVVRFETLAHCVRESQIACSHGVCDGFASRSPGCGAAVDRGVRPRHAPLWEWRTVRASVPPRSSVRFRPEARTRSRGSVEERPVHTGEVAGSNPAGTTAKQARTDTGAGLLSSPGRVAPVVWARAQRRHQRSAHRRGIPADP